MGRKNKTGKVLGQTKVKVVRTPTNPFETADTVEVFVPKEIIDRRILDICPGTEKLIIT